LLLWHKTPDEWSCGQSALDSTRSRQWLPD
jgi:hypothetical protein